jgi:hypothetical protein
VVAAGDRHRRLQVLPQGGPEGRREEERDERAPAGAPRRAHHPRGRRRAGRLLRDEGGRRRVRGGARLPPRDAEGRLQLARVVQPRPLAPLRHRGPGRQLGVGREDRGVLRDAQRLRAPAVLGVLHPVRRRRPDEHLRPREDRGAPLQVRLGHWHELQPPPRAAGEARGRRDELGPHELPRGARPRRGRDQVGRHHAARREDGLSRHGPPRDRRLHRVEGPRGEEGARPDRGGLLERLQRRGLPHGQRPELEQLAAHLGRVHARGRAGRRLADDDAHQQGARRRHVQGA